MRILLVGTHHRREIRGATVALHGLALALRDRGHAVTLLQAARPEHQQSLDGIRCVYVEDVRKSTYPIRMALRRLSGFDLIHANDNAAAFFALRSRLEGLPLVAQFHPPSVHGESFLRAGWRWRYIGLAARCAPRVLTPSRWLAEGLRARFGLDRARLHVLPLGIGEHWFRDPKPADRRAEETLRVALVNMKGVEVAMRAFTRVARRFRARLELFGLHRDEGALRHLARELGLEGRVLFHGFVPNEELPARLAGADVLLNPTRADNFPQVLLEAGALGIPAVSTAVGGVPEIVEEGVTGLLCPAHDDAPAFGRALERLLEDGATRRRMGRAARERARERWRWDAVVERLEEEVYGPASRQVFVARGASRPRVAALPSGSPSRRRSFHPR